MPEFEKKEYSEPMFWHVKSFGELNDKDIRKIDSFFQEHFPGVYDTKKVSDVLKWKLGKDNPAGTGFLNVAIDEQDRVVGVASATKRNIVSSKGLVPAVEVGDTFTSPLFRKQGQCRTPAEKNHNFYTNMDSNYLIKSVFGRLMYETLLQATTDGIVIAFGTPNNLSKPPYLKRFKFYEIDKLKVFSLYVFGNVRENHKKLIAIKVIQTIYTSLIAKLFVSARPFIELLDKHLWVERCQNLLSSNNIFTSSLEKNRDFYVHRYINHPTNNYSFYQVTTKGLKQIYLILRQKRNGDKQIVELIGKPTCLELFHILMFCRETESKISNLLAWKKISIKDQLKLNLLGIITVPNVDIIVRNLQDSSFEPDFTEFTLGDSDNG